MTAEASRVRLVAWERSTSRNEDTRGQCDIALGPMVIHGIVVSRRLGPIRLTMPLRFVLGPDGNVKHNNRGRAVTAAALSFTLEAGEALAATVAALIEAHDPGALAPLRLPPPKGKTP